MLYDLFISHATEDKNDFVRPLVESLKKNNIEVWYDEISLNVGDSLRESIDKGLSRSRFGLVVLSPSFFKKKWTKRELNGLFSRQEEGVILPIWHGVNHSDLLEHSPMLADVVALNSKDGLDSIAEKITQKIHPQGSPLIVARDELIEFDVKPPVITDEWWLDVIEASNRMANGGMGPIPEHTMWGRWTFPLPNFDSHGEHRGVRLAWTAMQMRWEEEAEKREITQITPPEKVLEFINEMPGLKEMCSDYPNFLSLYAPQLMIKGFGGDFENLFDKMLEKSNQSYELKKEANSISGTGLTTNKEIPLCDEEVALRHPQLGNYKASNITSYYFSGESMGPQTGFYEHLEHLVWLLSAESNWLPEKIKRILIEGYKSWTVWINYPNYKERGHVFRRALYNAKSGRKFQITEKIEKSLGELLEESKKIIEVSDDTSVILEKFLEEGFIEAFIKRNNRKR